MRHTEIALRRPVTTVMIFVALSLIGLVSVRLLPLEQFPDIEFPGIFIQVPYPNSTPEEIERTITRPIEHVSSEPSNDPDPVISTPSVVHPPRGRTEPDPLIVTVNVEASISRASMSPLPASSTPTRDGVVTR